MSTQVVLASMGFLKAMKKLLLDDPSIPEIVKCSLKTRDDLIISIHNSPSGECIVLFVPGVDAEVVDGDIRKIPSFGHAHSYTHLLPPLKEESQKEIVAQIRDNIVSSVTAAMPKL